MRSQKAKESHKELTSLNFKKKSKKKIETIQNYAKLDRSIKTTPKSIRIQKERKY
jgi:hypothetical protein